MLLTGKAKEDFEKWYFDNHCYSSMKFEELLPHHMHDVFGWLYNSSDTIQSAFIIEFFDSVGYFIHTKRFNPMLKFNEWYFIITNEDGVHLNNFLEDRIKEDSRKNVSKKQ